MLVTAQDWRDRRVLVTGHTGFKGGWLSLWLHQLGAEVTGLEGEEGKLSSVTLRDRASGEEQRREVSHLFSFIGAEPNTDWLSGTGIKLDGRGFVFTGAEAGDDRYPLGTSRRGIFAVGDVRSGSVKRVAAASGEGATVIPLVHQFLTPAEASPVP